MNPMNLSHKKSIDEIIENFNFKKVHKLMNLMDWKWATMNAEFRTPTLMEIKKEARRLLVDVANNSNSEWYIETGGFRAEKMEADYFRLSFVLTDWDNFESEDVEKERIKERILESHFNSPLIGMEV